MEIRWNDTPRARWDTEMRHAAWAQNWAYGAMLAQVGRPVHRAAIVEDGETVGHAQFTGRSFFGRVHIATCTRGPVWRCDVGEGVRREAYRRLRETIPLPWPRGIFFTPEAEAGESAALRGARFRQVMSPYSTAMLDLSAPEDDLLRAMQGKWRNRLRRAEGAGMAVTVARADGVMLATATRGGERLGAMLFLIHGAGALYHFGIGSAAGRAANAHNLLLWRAIHALRKRGVERLDLGGLDTVEMPGIARFKLGSGARVRTLCGTWC